ncbi:MAG: MoxR family ATPase, partial [Candidatus Aenigmarchaeota archaeon]|nr:MoxR family ATPase [Candidatus Aenigmarchaeota archaeon]
PIFTNLLLADEINRAPPKVQSALLQAMEEREVTIGKKTFKLPLPFLVFATINPQEEQGVFPLPEAQIDRFLFNLKMWYLEVEEEEMLMEHNVEIKNLEEFGLRTVIDLNDILTMQQMVKEIELPEDVKEYTVDIVNATRYPGKYKYELHEYVRWGGSPRAVIWLNFAGRANAFLEGRTKVNIHDIKETITGVLRHRLILTYEGKILNIDKDEIIRSILKEIPIMV